MTPVAIDVGGFVTVTLSTDAGVVERRTSGPSYSADFCYHEPLAFFYTPGGSAPYIPGGPGVMEFDPPVCAVGFKIEQDAASQRNDGFVEVWLDGVYHVKFSGIFIDSSSSGVNVAPFWIVSINSGLTTKRITKIRFGFEGNLLSGPGPYPFAIGSVGMCK